MLNRFDKGSSSVCVYHPETDDEYEIGCYWSWSSCPATLEQPAEEEFHTWDHEVTAINGVRCKAELPEWVDWDDYNQQVYEKERGW